MNDAFGTAHRAHSSMVGVDLPQRAAGYLLKKEIEYLHDAVESPSRPFVAIIGGAKVSGKIDVIEALLPKVDTLIIGGGMAYTFYKAQGKEIGGSLVEDDRVEMAKALLAKGGDKLVLPVDTVVTGRLDFGARRVGTLKTVRWDGIGPKDIGVDIGEKAREEFAGIVKGATTMLWNGPMGVFEMPGDSPRARMAIAQAVAEVTTAGAVSIVGGGDSVSRHRADGPGRPDHPRLHRRRRLPRVPRGPGAARRPQPER